MTAKRIAISVNTSWNLINFRRGLIAALAREGYEVIAVAPADAYSAQLETLGCRFVPIVIDNSGTNPLRDLQLTWHYWRILRRERVDVFLGFTIKPNIYGSWAAHLLNIRVINNVAGLGTAFINDNWLTRLVKFMYRFAFARSHRVFFQNPDDQKLFIENRLIDVEKTQVLPGSGIDLHHYQPIENQNNAENRAKGPFAFLLIGRLLWDKGIGEFVDAARKVKRAHADCRFQLLGFLDAQNRTAIAAQTLQEWVDEGLIEHLGETDDVRPFVADADCVVLPSYREGLPRTLLEAGAMARPVIASDVPGCRSVVEDAVTGYLCQVRNADDLAVQMERLLGLSAAERTAMGMAGRAKIEAEFSEERVIEAYLQSLADHDSNKVNIG